MKRIAPLAGLTTLTAIIALMAAVPASAAVPSNDDLANATAIAALPFADVTSTVEATAAPDDPTGQCNSGGASIWYAYTAANDGLVRADLRGSDFDTVVTVFNGPIDALTVRGCNDDGPGTVASLLDFSVDAGTTYYIMVAGFFGNTGAVNFTLTPPLPPLPPVTVSVNPTSGSVSSRGLVSIKGTVTCDQNAFVSFSLEGTQAGRRFTASGRSSEEVRSSCSTTPIPWAGQFSSTSGAQFIPGRISVRTSGFGQNDNGFSSFDQTSGLRLTGSR